MGLNAKERRAAAKWKAGRTTTQLAFDRWMKSKPKLPPAPAMAKKSNKPAKVR